MLPTLVVGLRWRASARRPSLLPTWTCHFHGGDVARFVAQAFAGVALVTYMSTSPPHRDAVRVPSTYAVLGKFLKGFSGVAVDTMTPTYGLLGAYATAFIATGLTAIPPLLLFLLLWRMQKREQAAAAR
jgi:PAT family beta-lactamase induction signal transducer AmpG